MKHHGNRVNELLKLRGFNKTDVAKIKGTTPQNVSHELSKKELSAKNLKFYSDFLKVQISEITESEKDVNNPKDNLLIEIAIIKKEIQEMKVFYVEQLREKDAVIRHFMLGGMGKYEAYSMLAEVA